MSDRMVVMYLGQVSEIGSSEALFARPRHPYTEALIAANPATHGKRESIRLLGTVPSPAAPPSGCRFHTRCPKATPACGWDVDDALRQLRQQGQTESSVQVSRTSPFAADLTFASDDAARVAVETLRAPAVPEAMTAAMTVDERSGKVVHVSFDPVAEVELRKGVGGRATACVLYSDWPEPFGIPTIP
jgi:oligopeptide/dipeptide ABC transporter ATP-binding protein